MKTYIGHPRSRDWVVLIEETRGGPGGLVATRKLPLRLDLG